MFRRLAAILAALGLVLMIAAPAFANTVQQSDIAYNDTNFQGDETECTTEVATGMTLWHFVHTGTSAGDAEGAVLTAQFLDANGQTVTLTAEGYQNGNDNSQVMYNITTPTGYTFVSGSDNINNTGNLNLSHICQGGPAPEIPEAPASALLVLSAGVLVAGFVLLRMRRSSTVA